MIAYLPAIYPDELVYSWFCRYYVHSGCFTHKMALQELYCNRSDNPSKEFIGNLKPEARAEIAKMYPLDMLTLNHTLFPQYARFVPLEQRKKALYHIGHDSCDIHHLFCVLLRTSDEQYLRYCPLCAVEDKKQYGEKFWHRKHQLRNVNVCTKHRCRLKATAIPAKSEQNYTFYPAENVIQDNTVVYEDNPTAIRFASYVESIFDAPMDFEKDIPISSVLYHGMSRTKYLKPSGRSRYTKMLADDIKAFYEGIGLCSIASMYQIQRVLLGSRFDFTVVCQIAFFIGMTVEELTSPSLTLSQIQREKDSHYMKDTAPVDWETLDAETAPVLEAVVSSIYNGSASDNGRPERVSERLVYREMGLLGHQLENMPRCKAIFEHYTESYPESWARKIIWAYQELQCKGVPFYWSDIRVLSGVKKKNFQETMPYLVKHTDADTVKHIVALVGMSAT
ncbi:MAG: TniQ family protein [Eubacteriales bacterium]|nr:TniQ family protein [Eubacteriales bacterium]